MITEKCQLYDREGDVVAVQHQHDTIAELRRHGMLGDPEAENLSQVTDPLPVTTSA